MADKKYYNKYAWVGNGISESDMAAMYKRKQAGGAAIVQQVAAAVAFYNKHFQVTEVNAI
jgi:hypothetical protein